jgi:hypothetical protein
MRLLSAGAPPLPRKLNRRAALLPLASLVSLDSFASLHPPQAALGSLTLPKDSFRHGFAVPNPSRGRLYPFGILFINTTNFQGCNEGVKPLHL